MKGIVVCIYTTRYIDNTRLNRSYTTCSEKVSLNKKSCTEKICTEVAASSSWFLVAMATRNELKSKKEKRNK